MKQIAKKKNQLKFDKKVIANLNKIEMETIKGGNMSGQFPATFTFTIPQPATMTYTI
ncbi:hypothetical protein QO200_03705 [Flavobacterium sp. Arc3]|uniref:hypothetical protein n=1 Tax=Flavobacterium sp. Arc3 TaxID=3046686 RepID=UPI00352F40B0